MDPNLFHLDWERTFEVLATIVVLAFLIERALAIVFEHRLFIERFGMKEFIALAVSIAFCGTSATLVWEMNVKRTITLEGVAYEKVVRTWRITQALPLKPNG